MFHPNREYLVAICKCMRSRQPQVRLYRVDDVGKNTFKDVQDMEAEVSPPLQTNLTQSPNERISFLKEDLNVINAAAAATTSLDCNFEKTENSLRNRNLNDNEFLLPVLKTKLHDKTIQCVRHNDEVGHASNHIKISSCHEKADKNSRNEDTHDHINFTRNQNDNEFKALSIMRTNDREADVIGENSTCSDSNGSKSSIDSVYVNGNNVTLSTVYIHGLSGKKDHRVKCDKNASPSHDLKISSSCEKEKMDLVNENTCDLINTDTTQILIENALQPQTAMNANVVPSVVKSSIHNISIETKSSNLTDCTEENRNKATPIQAVSINRSRNEQIDSIEFDNLIGSVSHYVEVSSCIVKENMDIVVTAQKSPSSSENNVDEIVPNSDLVDSDLVDSELELSGRRDTSIVEFVRVSDLSDILRVDELSLLEPPLPNISNENVNDNDDTEYDKDYEVPSDNDQSDSRDTSESSSDDNIEGEVTDTSRSLNVSCAAGAIDDDVLFAQPKIETKSKQNFCYYCKKLQTVISRHLEKIHYDEEVKQFAILPRGNPERKKIIEMIRLRGNYLYNRNSEYNKEGNLIVPRRPKEERSARFYKVCHNCKGTYSMKTIRRHRKRCTGETSKHSRSNTILSRRIAGRLHERAGKRLKDVVFCVLREDEIVRLIRYDELLIVFANDLCEKYVKQQQHNMIRARIRLLGRLLRTSKKICPEITDFASIYQPRFYDTVIAAIKIEAGYDAETGEHKIPSVVTTLGTYLKKVCDTFIVECIKKEAKEKKKLAEDFLKIHNVTYHSTINKAAVETQLKKNRQQQKPLPTTDDIQKLQSYLSAKWKEAYGRLQTQYAYDVWHELSKTTLIQVLLFNRRRVGEIERTHIDDLKNCERVNEKTNPELYNSLSNEEKSCVNKYARFVICGKLGRSVPVLISSQMEASLNLILKYRSAAAVHPKNPFVFGVPGFDKGRYKYLRACELMRQYAVECGAENPERLRGTALRKHIATTCATMNVDENQIHDIANFMGHADDIHRRHYRQSNVRRDVCGVSKMLESAMGIDESDSFSEEDTEIEKRKRQNTRPRSIFSDVNDTSSALASTSCDRIRRIDATKSMTATKNKFAIDNTRNMQSTLQKNQRFRKKFNAVSCKVTHNDSDNENEDETLQNTDDSDEFDKTSKKRFSKQTKKKSSKIMHDAPSNVFKDEKKKIRWTQEEKDVAWCAFGDNIKNAKRPSTKIMRKFLKENVCVRRTVAQLSTWVSNEIKTMNRGQDW